MKVNICGIPHNIVHESDTFDGGWRGQIRHQKQEIAISDNLKPELEEMTMIHEIVHGILLYIGRDDLSNDETFVTSLATAMYPIFDIRFMEN